MSKRSWAESGWLGSRATTPSRPEVRIKTLRIVPRRVGQGKPSLIIGIQRGKASIRTQIAARFHHSPSSTEGRHVPAPVGGCRRPHYDCSTSSGSESSGTPSTTSTILHRHYAGAATQPPASPGAPTPERSHGVHGRGEWSRHHP